MSGKMSAQPWIGNRSYDTAFILLPPFLALFLVALLPASYTQGGSIPIAAWVIIVLCLDVGHVYSTLFRTYFDSARFRRQRSLYIAIPLVCYIAGVLLYTTGGWLFWRVLAYTAVFHFIRQQYGFMRLYSRLEGAPAFSRMIDTITIYAAAIYPIIYWHFTPGRQFNWFLEGDFLQWNNPFILKICGWLYLAILTMYAAKEVYAASSGKTFNIPRNAIIIGTAVSWYFGIVYFNGDLVFTLLNVVSHGIPYMALIWFTARKDKPTDHHPGDIKRLLLRWYGIGIFLAVILVGAWLEEGLWDRWVWDGEHLSIFKPFALLPAIGSEGLLVWLVPLLALPQATHYVLDGFIWRRKDG